MATFRIIGCTLLALACISSCGKDDEATDSTPAEEDPGVPEPGAQPDGGDGGGTTGGGTTEAKPCGTLADGETTTRVRYKAASVVKGLGTCEAETQTMKCEAGVLGSTGTFTAESCAVVFASVQPGDILVATEPATSSNPFTDGEILAFGGDGLGFKGVAFDKGSLSPWYTYGLRLSFDYFTDKYHVEVGSADANLAIMARRFPTVSAYPYTFSTPAEGPASDALYFQGAFSEEYLGMRRVAVSDGTMIDVYIDGVGKRANCTINMPMGKHARAIFSGTQSYDSETYVAYTLGTNTSVTGYGVAKLTGAVCQSGTDSPQTVTTQFEDTNFPNAKVTSLSHVRSSAAPGTNSWKGDIFVTVGPFLSRQYAHQWHYNSGMSTWSEVTPTFRNDALAVFQDGRFDVYTYEYDGTEVTLNRYGVEESGGTHFISELFAGSDDKILRGGSLGHWLIVMPPLP